MLGVQASTSHIAFDGNWNVGVFKTSPQASMENIYGR